MEVLVSCFLVRILWISVLLIECAIGQVIAARGLPSKRCYSCMSDTFIPHWDKFPFLSKYYLAPGKFTNHCNTNTFDATDLAIVPCNMDNACILIQEPNTIGGFFAGHNYIRGCSNQILKHGFNSSAYETHQFNRKEHCRTLARSQIFRDFEHSTDFVRICNCFGNLCNGRDIHTALSAERKYPSWLILANVFAVLFLTKKVMM